MVSSRVRKSSLRLSAAFLLGGLFPLAFAPFGQGWLAFFLLGSLFWLVARSVSARQAAGLGFFFGFGAFVSGVYWLSITLHNFAHMDWPLAAAAVALLAACCALYPALAMGVARRFAPSARWWLMPVLWIFSEFLRARLATGFPWLATGYTQTWAFLAGYAPWLGQYGVGLATAGVAAIGAWILTRHREVAIWSMGVSAILLIFAGALFGATQRFTQPSGAPIAVRLLQGNIPISEKWDAARISSILDRYVHLIIASPPGTQLVVLPETAFPIFQTEIPALLGQLQQWSAQKHTILMIGMPEAAHGRYYNATLEIDGHKAVRWYRKQHLVPFGEYIPFPRILGPLVHHFLPGLGSFTPGQGPSVLPVDGQLAGMSICYEESFSRDVRKGVVQGATFLVNSSDYAWYGHSSASAQTLQMAAMQALQEQKPDIRATNTGITSVILPNGNVIAELPQFSIAALNAHIQPMAGETPFARYGNWPYLVISALLLLFAWWRSRLR
ncbi:apolipoprotein N-acyltransferase [Acidithiobacillus sp. CV18-2]|uniref:Apolipoprotein N-acyltransferase n=1 Tax=Igneacidithiobacillus copahuensis TaxID=2724909 RepID=A0AAE2YRE4_9PROT|nr:MULTISPECIES: apolipoprotein N-acyltransferase [Acidithiobacillaceae]MBU2755183.1 apolipoprotein N-acyltransferase [Acidithiobacillus sp. CV18-3]MBU2756889.1 apolipoprotein N-acyltransferase [Acidithiobacillus sp. BN09-2]MBU2778013.1 apolipoprotein N-acyltransferase [Acidithiobacillus sp. CV18-2]MBU2796635.1 apolipoprotein N-acyltransferase [Acidithiobacillus sp. VAN18-2]MBU2799600.1 apolipoprotein N-acyltransferase [Acidithiobacillus sp. VAN18-4]